MPAKIRDKNGNLIGKNDTVNFIPPEAQRHMVQGKVTSISQSMGLLPGSQAMTKIEITCTYEIGYATAAEIVINDLVLVKMPDKSKPELIT